MNDGYDKVDNIQYIIIKKLFNIDYIKNFKKKYDLFICTLQHSDHFRTGQILEFSNVEIRLSQLILALLNLNKNGHILLQTEVIDEDKTKTYKIISDLSKKISTKNNFVSIAKEYSKDETTKDNGGLLGWINTDTYQVEELSTIIKNIPENTCSTPILTDFGYHLLWIDEIEEGGLPTIEKNWIELEQLALNKKKSDWYSNWIEKIKTKVYIKRNPLNYPQITN